MPDPKPTDPRRLPPATVVQLLNSHHALGPVLTLARLRAHRLAAGFRISADGETVDMLRYIAWLAQRRHAEKDGGKPRKQLGPRFSGEGPRFG